MRTPYRQIKVYRNSYDTAGVTASLDAVIQRINTGDKGLDEKTRYCHALAQTEPAAYKAYKEKDLPAVTFSGTFPKGKRKAQHLSQHSGLVPLDIDGLTAEQIPDLLAELAQISRVVLAFISPSGLGIKVIVRVDPIPRNDLEHKGAYQTCLEFFEPLSEEYGFTIDTSGNDSSRLCYLSHDTRPIVHTDSVPIEWDREAWLTAEKEKQKRFEADAKRAYTGEVDITVLDHIDPNDLDYNQWLSVLTACKVAKLTWKQADAWSRRGGVRYIEGEVKKRWSGLNLDVSWGAVVKLAKQNGYEPPTPPNRKRYTIDTQYQHTTSTIETERQNNHQALVDWITDTDTAKGNQHLLINTAAAGTGKTTTALVEASELLYLAKTTDEADTVFAFLDGREEDVIRHRPRLHNRDRDDWERLPLGLGADERPCIKPELCNELAQQGHSTRPACSRCPKEQECSEDGYLSQARKERNAAKVVMAHSEIVACDSREKHHIQQRLTKDGILIVDEAHPANLTQRRIVTRLDILELQQRWNTPHTQNEYQALRDLFYFFYSAETPVMFIQALQAHLASLTDIKALDEKLEKYPITYTFENAPKSAPTAFIARIRYKDTEKVLPVVEWETADDTPAFFVDEEHPITTGEEHHKAVTLESLIKWQFVDIDAPPRKYVNLLTDLQTFFKENAVFADIDKRLRLHQAGSENTELETAPFTYSVENQTFEYHLKPTLNHRRAIFNSASDTGNLIQQCYQGTDIQITTHTGTPPAWKETSQVFQIRTGNYLPRHSLHDKDGRLKDYAKNIVEGLIQPTIAAGLKTLIVAPKAMHDSLQHLDTSVINHHHAEGRNDFQDHDVVFVFHYEPNHHEIQAQAKRIYRTAEPPLDFTRERTDITQGSVSFQKNAYTDDRVQAIYDRDCRERLMQSAMRLRPNINDNKIIVFLTAEPVDIPITPTPFTLTDTENFTGDFTAWQTDKTADRDAEIERLHREGKTQAEIAEQVGLSQGRVSQILKVTCINDAIKGPSNAINNDVTLAEKILSALQNASPLSTALILEVVDGHNPTAIKNELKRMVDRGDIRKVKRGVYDLPDKSTDDQKDRDARKEKVSPVPFSRCFSRPIMTPIMTPAFGGFREKSEVSDVTQKIPPVSWQRSGHCRHRPPGVCGQMTDITQPPSRMNSKDG